MNIKDINSKNEISLHFKDFKSGITLIALVITIIVLLILAGVSIALLTGDNGILTKANIASEETRKQGSLEKVQIATAGSYGKDGKIDKNVLKNSLNQLEGIEQITDDINTLPITIAVDGYKIIISEIGKVDFIEGGTWTGFVNSPKLTSDMTPVYWDSSNNEVETAPEDPNWYDYNNQKWANAKTSDGSYWVWIPRYAYKITSGLYTSNTGTIEIKFLQNTSDKDELSNTISKTYPSVNEDSMAEYVIHPVFTNGTLNNFENGEWDQELSGIWISKFESGIEENGIPIITTDRTIGNINTTNSIKIVSKPGVSSWRWISTGISYTNSYNYDRNKDSHIIKNSEWGAVAYLTHSKYGKNGTQINPNIDSSYYTGGGQGDAYKTNVTQSTTGNTTGIYDMSGGVWETVSSYIANGYPCLEENCSSFAINTSTKYTTVYPYNLDKEGSTINYNKYKESANTRFGDAILEVSSEGKLYTCWFEDFSNYPHEAGPLLLRGGFNDIISESGIFAFNNGTGGTFENGGFRLCLSF